MKKLLTILIVFYSKLAIAACPEIQLSDINTLDRIISGLEQEYLFTNDYHWKFMFAGIEHAKKLQSTKKLRNIAVAENTSDTRVMCRYRFNFANNNYADLALWRPVMSPAITESIAHSLAIKDAEVSHEIKHFESGLTLAETQEQIKNMRQNPELFTQAIRIEYAIDDDYDSEDGDEYADELYDIKLTALLQQEYFLKENIIQARSIHCTQQKSLELLGHEYRNLTDFQIIAALDEIGSFIPAVDDLRGDLNDNA
jgi:hypothetical protein